MNKMNLKFYEKKSIEIIDLMFISKSSLFNKRSTISLFPVLTASVNGVFSLK